MNDIDKLTLVALLHSIGMAISIYRSGTPGRLGHKFLTDLSKKSRKSEYAEIAPFSLLLDGWEEFEKTIAGHREREKLIEMAKVITRSAELVGICNGSVRVPLRSVFTLIRKEGETNPKPSYYPPVELDLEKEFPVPKPELNVSPESYATLFGKLEYELVQPNFIPKPSRIMATLERYTTFIPACDGNSGISFYDRARLIAALATALYMSKSEKPFLLIEGDLSGIQSFVFRITSRGALKELRARSVYLDLLSWDVIIEILERLGLPRTSVLYNGGGSFTLIAPNTLKIVERLESLRRELERFLLEKFDGSIYIALEWVEASEEDMRTFRNGVLWNELKERVNERKTRRFLEVINEGEKNPFVDPKGYTKLEECEVCRKQITRREFNRFVIRNEEGEPALHLCQNCYELWYLGTSLPKVELFARVPRSLLEEFGVDSRRSVELPFSRIYWFRNLEELRTYNVPPGSVVLLKNTFELWKVPEEYEAIPYVVADYAKLENDGQVMNFEHLAENSIGAPRIGVFKADVDDLGFIFGRGLPRSSPALVAGLSRLMDYFFKAYLNALIRGSMRAEELSKEAPRLPTSEELGNERYPGDSSTRANIVVVYAGGDDLFIVGAWNEIFNLTFMAREAFRLYTGDNPNITISAGVGFFAHDYPVERMASATETRLETAKHEGKNRVMLLDRTKPRGQFENFTVSYSWDEYKSLWQRYGKKFLITGDGLYVEKKNGKMKVPKSVLWKILEFRDMYAKNPRNYAWSYLMAYYLSRAGMEDVFRGLIPINVRLVREGKPQEIYWMDGVVKPLLLAIRG